MNQHDRDNLFTTLGRVESNQHEQGTKLDLIDTRVRRLENFKIKMIAAAGGASFLGSVFFPKLAALFH